MALIKPAFEDRSFLHFPSNVGRRVTRCDSSSLSHRQNNVATLTASVLPCQPDIGKSPRNGTACCPRGGSATWGRENSFPRRSKPCGTSNKLWASRSQSKRGPVGGNAEDGLSKLTVVEEERGLLWMPSSSIPSFTKGAQPVLNNKEGFVRDERDCLTKRQLEVLLQFQNNLLGGPQTHVT
ncbi:hypothetical protein Bbelb_232850 [Branchiostoma belcheri]|nr:hypothetical protein Bbelb_232850 [Branchiostoma belcheri]